MLYIYIIFAQLKVINNRRLTAVNVCMVLCVMDEDDIKLHFIFYIYMKVKIGGYRAFLKQAMFSWSVNRNPNPSPDKSTRISIRTLTNQSES